MTKTKSQKARKKKGKGKSLPPRQLATPRPTLQLKGPQNTSVIPLTSFTVMPGTTPGGSRVRGKEMVGSVNTAAAIVAGAFTLLRVGATQSHLLNPGAFPRLLAYLPIYEFFRFNSVKYTFISNQPTTAAGTVMMSVEYDVADNPPATAIAVMRNLSSVMSNIYSTMETRALASMARLQKYSTSQDVNINPAQIYQSRLDIAVEGITVAAATTFGYLQVEYDVEFFTPQ